MPFISPLPADRVRALTANCRPAVTPEPPRSETPEETAKRILAQKRHKQWLKNHPEKVAEYLRKKNEKNRKNSKKNVTR